MDVMDVKQFSEIELSSDGNAVIVTAECSDGSPTKCTIPYRHALWLAKAILSVSHQAVERQAASGAIEPFTIAQEALQVETVEVYVKPNQESAAIDSVGRWTSNNSPGTTTLLIDRSHAQVLIDQLREFVQMAQSLFRPS
jgi:hypothetical protein